MSVSLFESQDVAPLRLMEFTLQNAGHARTEKCVSLIAESLELQLYSLDGSL